MQWFAWLFPRPVPDVDAEIARLTQSIAERDRSIAATVPIVREAIDRTDDVYYRLRNKVKIGERRLQLVSDRFSGDLEQGWRRPDG